MCMVNVNQNELPNEDLARLFKQFDTILTKLDHGSMTIFLSELLGKEERLTLAKRLATIVLISEGWSAYRTSQLLKMSPTTTGIIAVKVEKGEYAGIIALCTSKKRDYFALLDTLDSILHLGGILPHRVGLDRYRNLNRSFPVNRKRVKDTH